MGDRTGITWTDHTYNPWWGCVKVSPACDFCYAERDAHRYGFADGGGNGPELWGKGTERRRLSDKTLNRPLVWDRDAAAAGRPALVFCASMADVFEARDDLDPDRARLWDLIERTPNLRWQLLTKRPEQIRRRVPRRWLEEPGNLMCDRCGASASIPLGASCPDHDPRPTGWPPHAWVGATVEDQHFAELRVPRLLEVPAPVRFLSIEPLLGEVVLRPEWLVPPANLCGARPKTDEDRVAIAQVLRAAGRQLGWAGIDWAIIGGESGPGFRPMDLGHARAVAGQLTAAGVPTFFKQVSGLRSGNPGPEDLEALKGFPPEAGPRDGVPVEVGS